MKILRELGWGLLALGTLALASCGSGGGGGGGSQHSGGHGTMSVRLVDAPTADYTAINLHIASVEVGSDSGWITLGAPDAVFDLLQLTGGLSATLTGGTTLPAGHFSQMRLILGTGSTVTLADGSEQPLKVPSGMQTGVKVPINVTVAAGDVADVWIDFDAASSIQLHSTGNSGQYILRPVVRAVTKTETGSISGVFTDVANGFPLAGVTVFAETVDDTGVPHVARGTFTDDTGAYTLDLLPLGHTYFVVSMPTVGGDTPVAYAALASDALSLSMDAPSAGFTAAFTAAGVGTLSGAVTPAAGEDQSDLVNLMQPLGTSGQALIVATTVAPVEDTAETYTFQGIAAGNYTVQAVRSTEVQEAGDDDGDMEGDSAGIVANDKGGGGHDDGGDDNDENDDQVMLTFSPVAGPVAVTAGNTSTLDITFGP